MEEPYEDFVIVDRFCVGKNWENYYEDIKKKQVCFVFKPSDEEKIVWMENGFTKLKHLLLFLEKQHGGLDNFELVFFKEQHPKPFYIKQRNGKPCILINVDEYRAYGRELDPVVRALKIIKYGRKIWSDFSKKVPEKFFKGEPTTALIDELKTSYYTVIEHLIKEFENMSDEDKQKIKDKFEHSQLGTEVINKYVKFNPEAPEIQLKKFIEVIEKLGESEVEELLNSILSSRISSYFIKTLSKLPIREQNKIIKKMPEMSRMYDRYEKLKKSLKEFENKIKEHQSSQTKDEKDIHKLLVRDYWLLGIEYFDKPILSDITADGKPTGNTKIGRKHSDFIIKRIDGLDKCIVVELEEANDSIFNKDGSFSKEVYDGITQAVDYYIEQRCSGINSKGMVVVGSTLGMKLDAQQKERLRLLKETFHNVEVLTYDDIIEKAKNTINFWKKYEIGQRADT